MFLSLNFKDLLLSLTSRPAVAQWLEWVVRYPEQPSYPVHEKCCVPCIYMTINLNFNLDLNLNYKQLYDVDFV